MARPLRMAQIFRHRDPALLLTGQAISNFGDGVVNVALTLLVLDTTNDSVSRLSWFAAARMVPLVAFLLFGGAIVDRFSRRLLLLTSDSTRAVLTAAVAVLILTHHLHYWELLVYAFLFGTFDAVFMPAIASIMPQVVPEELLPAANSTRQLSSSLLGQMAGPALGGLIAAFSTSLALTIDSATFVVSATALVIMRPTARPERQAESSMVREIREGLHFVAHTRWLWTTLLAVALGNAFIFTPMGALIPVFLVHNLHLGKAWVGYSFAAGGVAGTLGALFSGNMRPPRHRVRVMWAYWAAAVAACFIVAVATNFWELVWFPIIASPGIIMGNVIWETLMQAEVPTELMGRVSSVDWFGSLGLAPVGLVVAGQVAGAIGIRQYFVLFGVLCLLPTVWIFLSPKINAIDRVRITPAPAVEP